MSTAATRRHEFPAFPFEPYSIQSDFMDFLYDALNKGGIAMLESPTGTGKTLSIICSAMQWVVDQRERKKQQQHQGLAGNDEDEPDWMRDFVVPAVEEGTQTRKIGSRTKDLKKKAPFPKAKSTEAIDMGTKGGDGDAEDDFLMDEYESEEEEIGRLKRKHGRRSRLCSSDEDEEEVDDDEEEVTPKVYFTSRTHSQLSQFVKEFNRTGFANKLKLACLGSRKNMCINPEVMKLGYASRMNERCLELQKNKKETKVKVSEDGKMRHTKPSSGCPMLRKQKLRSLFKTKVWEQDAMDIEDLVQLGSKIGSCPYYGSRDMVRASDIVVLPYQSLLLRSARESLGLNLKDSIIVIDEAHNLADCLTSMYNSKITKTQLKQIYSCLESYLNRFRVCLGAVNRRYIQTMILLTQSFLHLFIVKDCQKMQNDACIKKPCATLRPCEQNADTSMTINDFVFSLNIDNINLVKLHTYLKESNIIHKVSGYGAKLESLEKDSSCSKADGVEGSILSGLQSLAGIIISLVNNDSDGRIIVSKQGDEGYLKFVMLSGDVIFSEIMDQAYAVILAGGTLQPIEETRLRLFPGVSLDQVNFFTCDHIIPPESILPIEISRGPSGMTFDFSYSSRSSLAMIEELGRLISNLVAVVPEGVVIFFSSFDYENQVYSAWKDSGALTKILRRKLIYREPRSSNEVETVLKEYKQTIDSCSGMSKASGVSGAILLAVVGGKISEGINFSDGMGRCIVMVGLPYPSPYDVELMERIKHIDGQGGGTISQVDEYLSNKYIDDNKVNTGFGILRRCKERGREYYENLCMKAVNQSIGRAIRHINDYAAILLVDSRYVRNSVDRTNCSHPIDKLPLWIKSQLVLDTQSYGEVHRKLNQFFQVNKQKTDRKGSSMTNGLRDSLLPEQPSET